MSSFTIKCEFNAPHRGIRERILKVGIVGSQIVQLPGVVISFGRQVRRNSLAGAGYCRSATSNGHFVLFTISSVTMPDGEGRAWNAEYVP